MNINNYPCIEYLFDGKIKQAITDNGKILLLELPSCAICSSCIGRNLFFIESSNQSYHESPILKEETNDSIRNRFSSKMKARIRRPYVAYQFDFDICDYIYDKLSQTLLVLTNSGDIFAVYMKDVLVKLNSPERMDINESNEDIFSNLLKEKTDSSKTQISNSSVCCINDAFCMIQRESNLYVMFSKREMAGITVCSITRQKNHNISLEIRSTFSIPQTGFKSNIFLISTAQSNICINAKLFETIFGRSGQDKLFLFCSSRGTISYHFKERSEILCDLKQPIRDCLSLSIKEIQSKVNENSYPQVSNAKNHVEKIKDQMQNNMLENNCLCFVGTSGKCLSIFQQTLIHSSMFYENQLLSSILCCSSKDDLLVTSSGENIYTYKVILSISNLKKLDDNKEILENFRISVNFQLVNTFAIPNIQTLKIVHSSPFEVLALRQSKLMKLVSSLESKSLQLHSCNIEKMVENINKLNCDIERLRTESSVVFNKLMQVSMDASIIQNVKSSQLSTCKNTAIDVEVKSLVLHDDSRKRLLLTCKIINHSKTLLFDGWVISVAYYKMLSNIQQKNDIKTTNHPSNSEFILMSSLKPKASFEFNILIDEQFVSLSSIVFDFYLHCSFNRYQMEDVDGIGGSCFLKSVTLGLLDLCTVHQGTSLTETRSECKYVNTALSLSRSHQVLNTPISFSMALSSNFTSDRTLRNKQASILRSNIFNYLLEGKVGIDHSGSISLSHFNGMEVILSLQKSNDENHLGLGFSGINFIFLAWLHLFVLQKLKNDDKEGARNCVVLEERIKASEGTMERLSSIRDRLDGVPASEHKNRMYLDEILQIYFSLRRKETRIV